jgi:hypothetical protein
MKEMLSPFADADLEITARGGRDADEKRLVHYLRGVAGTDHHPARPESLALSLRAARLNPSAKGLPTPAGTAVWTAMTVARVKAKLAA